MPALQQLVDKRGEAEDDDHGEEQAIHAVENAAVAGDDGAAVLDASAAFEQ